MENNFLNFILKNKNILKELNVKLKNMWRKILKSDKSDKSDIAIFI